MPKIKFIGTGSGKTSLKRFHSAFIISSSKYNLLVDAGDGISKALLAQNIHLSEIDGIVITHLHPDHFSGLASLIIQMKMSRRTKQLDLFCNEDILGNIKTFLNISYVMKERLDFELNFVPAKYNSAVVVSENISFVARKNTHLIHYGEEFNNESVSSSSSSLLFQIDQANIFYTGDLGSESDLNLFNDQSIDILISEVTHLNFDEIVKFGLMKGVKTILLIHIPDEIEESLSRKVEDAAKQKAFQILLSYDGLTYNPL